METSDDTIELRRPFTFSKDALAFFSKQTSKTSYEGRPVDEKIWESEVKFEILFREILRKIGFFERPDIIPYPFKENFEEIDGGRERTDGNYQGRVRSTSGNSKACKTKKKNHEEGRKKSPQGVKGAAYEVAEKEKKVKTSKNGKNSTSDLNEKKNTGSKETEFGKQNILLPGKDFMDSNSKNKASFSKKSSSSKDIKAKKLGKINKERGDFKIDIEDTGIDCEKCVRLHKHLWAKTQS